MTENKEVRLREKLPAPPEGDPKETGGRLASEGKMEKDAAGYGWHRPADLYALRLGAFRYLLPPYLEEYGLSAEAALEALNLLGSGAMYDLASLEEADKQRLHGIQRRYSLAGLVAQSLLDDSGSELDPERPVEVEAPADLVEQIREEAREIVAGSSKDSLLSWAINGPRCVREEAAEYEALVAPYELSRSQRNREARSILRDRPDPIAYLRTKGWAGGFLSGNPRRVARQVLEELVRQNVERPGAHLAPSVARLIVPQAFLSLNEPVAKMAERRGRFTPYNEDTRLGLAELVEVTEGRAQMAEFSATEMRVVIGTLACFSERADDGKAWPSTIRVGFRTFADACALDLSSGKNRDDLLDAINRVSSRPVHATIISRDNGANDVMLYTSPILKAGLIVYASDPGSEASLETWRETGKWRGESPREIILQLQGVHAYLRSALVLDATVLHRIDAVAKRIRGRVVDLDLVLFWQLFKIGPRQLNGSNTGPNGSPLTYIDRTQFLRDFHGEERLVKDKRKGRYGRVEEAYLKSVEILVEAGILFEDWKENYRGRNGTRDVFEVQPWVVRSSPKKLGSTGAPKLITARRGKR
jgi:hypothetical protein